MLVDSPRFTEALAGPIAELGGLRHVVFTHRDDVADGRRWAERFGARSWIHLHDRPAARWASDLLGDEQGLQPGFLAIPVPGHTKGSVVFLLDGRWLFTGDSLAWSHERQDLTAFRGACWYSWSEQSDSLARLAEHHRFAAVLPGHGGRHIGEPGDLHERLVRLVARMRSGLGPSAAAHPVVEPAIRRTGVPGRVEELEDPLGGASQDGAIAEQHDRALDEDRVAHHGVEELLSARALQAELLPGGLGGPHHLARIVASEEGHDLLELLPAR